MSEVGILLGSFRDVAHTIGLRVTYVSLQQYTEANRVELLRTCNEMTAAVVDDAPPTTDARTLRQRGKFRSVLRAFADVMYDAGYIVKQVSACECPRPGSGSGGGGGGVLPSASGSSSSSSSLHQQQQQQEQDGGVNKQSRQQQQQQQSRTWKMEVRIEGVPLVASGNGTSGSVAQQQKHADAGNR